MKKSMEKENLEEGDVKREEMEEGSMEEGSMEEGSMEEGSMEKGDIEDEDAEGKMEESVEAVVDRFIPWLLEFRRKMHEHPELGLKEFQTSAMVKEALEDRGIPHTDCYETGILAWLNGRTGGRAIALRADMDALPVREDTGVSFCSKTEGVMHACGHDVHTAILLGTAMVLKHYSSKLKGTVKFLFQPAEENAGGAKGMIGCGALKNPPVDRIFGLHVWPKLGKGQFAVCDGPAMAGFCSVRIKLKGKGGHISAPHLAQNPIYGGAALIQAIQLLRTQKVDPEERLVFDVSAVHAGGAVSNTIPEEFQLAASLRTYSKQVAVNMEKELVRLLEGMKLSYDLEYELDFKYGYEPVVNDGTAAKELRRAAERAAGISVVKSPADFGSEDFGYYLRQTPGAFGFLGVDQECDCSLHSPHFLPDEDSIRRGILIYCQAVFDFLTSEGGEDE